MKKEKITKEITLTGNTSIKFGDPDSTNGDMLIMGNFKDICGHAEWYGKHSGENYWSVDMTKFNETTIMTNVGMIVNTIRNGHKIFFIGSANSIDYWTNLVCNFASHSYAFFTDGEEPSDATIKRILKNQIIKVVNDVVYEDAARMYGNVKTTKSSKELNERIKNNINTLFNNIKKTKMNFSNIVLNPPYNGSLHLEILKKSLDLLTDDGHLVVVEPATWLINVREIGRTKLYDDIKQRIDGHVSSVVIENLNHDFNIALDTPFAITTIDMNSQYETIDFVCCGEHKLVKSIYDCNLIGEYKTIRSIINKVKSYGNMMDDHIYSAKTGKTYEAYLRYWRYQLYALGSNYRGVVKQYLDKTIAVYRELNFGSFFSSYVDSLYYNDVQSTIPLSKNGNICDCLCGTKSELENWKYNVENNKLFVFLTICTVFDKHNMSMSMVPFMCDKHYTMEEIVEIFGFTDDEIKLIYSTIEKFSYDSPWFKRYICGKDSQDETIVPEPTNIETSKQVIDDEDEE